MPISPSEWDSRITEEARTQYLKDKYGQEAVDVIELLSDRPEKAFTARELVTRASPFINHSVHNMHSSLDKHPVASGPTVSDDSNASEIDDEERERLYAEAEEKLTDLLEDLVDGGFVEKRGIQTKTGVNIYYRFNSYPSKNQYGSPNEHPSETRRGTTSAGSVK